MCLRFSFRARLPKSLSRLIKGVAYPPRTDLVACKGQASVFVDALIVRGLMQKTGIDEKTIEDLILGCAFPEGEQGFSQAGNEASNPVVACDCLAHDLVRFLLTFERFFLQQLLRAQRHSCRGLCGFC